jgi:hypothetical protein
MIKNAPVIGCDDHTLDRNYCGSDGIDSLNERNAAYLKKRLSW